MNMLCSNQQLLYHVSGIIEPGSCTFEGALISKLTAGERSTITVETRDRFGNELKGDSDFVFSTGSGAKLGHLYSSWNDFAVFWSNYTSYSAILQHNSAY